MRLDERLVGHVLSAGFIAHDGSHHAIYLGGMCHVGVLDGVYVMHPISHELLVHVSTTNEQHRVLQACSQGTRES